jgi:hypothetical protein
VETGHTEETGKEDRYEPMNFWVRSRPTEPFRQLQYSLLIPNGRLTYPNMAIGIQIAAIGAGFNLSSGLGNSPSFASNIGAR